MGEEIEVLESNDARDDRVPGIRGPPIERRFAGAVVVVEEEL